MLVSRTEIACEACKLDEEANIFNVQYLSGENFCVDAADISVKVRAHYPKEISQLVTYYRY